MNSPTTSPVGYTNSAAPTPEGLSTREIQQAVQKSLHETEQGLFPDEDLVNHPSHYQSFVAGLNIEAIDCMRAAFGDEDVLAFCLCNAMKYIYRCKSKGGSESIRKAIWYLNKFLELSEPQKKC